MTMRFRTSKRSIDVPWDKAQELKGRLTMRGVSGAAQAMELRAPAGVLWAHEDKRRVLVVLEDRLATEHIDDLGRELIELRDVLHEDLDN